MSKRELSMYEVVNKKGATVAWADTMPKAKKLQRVFGPGTFFRPKVVPIRADQLADFMTLLLSNSFVYAGQLADAAREELEPRL